MATTVNPKWRSGLKANVSKTTKTNGNILVCTDSGELFIDINDVRVQITDIVQDTEANITALGSDKALAKIYFATDTLYPYFYSNGWNKLKCAYADSAAEATHATSADSATTANKATSATSATKATQDASGNTITSTYAKLASPTFTGTPKAPTAAAGTNTTQIASTAFVTTAIANAVSGITQFDFSVVESLPSTGTKGVIYLVSNSGSGTNVYDEYIYVDSKFERLGTTDIDLSDYVKSATLASYALKTDLDVYAKTADLANYVTLTGSEAISGKTYEGYTLGAACAKDVKDNSTATALTSSGTGLVTERSVYNGLPSINNSHAYTSSTTIYAPTAGGTANYFLLGAGTTTAPKWVSFASIPPYIGIGYGTCATAEATTAKVGTLSNYQLVTGGIVAIKFTYAVPASSTLNINSKGAKSIYRNGAAITAGVIKAGDIVGFVYNGSQYEVIAINNEGVRASDLDAYVKTTVLADYAKTSALDDYAKTATLADYVTLTGTEALTNKTYNGYTLADAAAKGVTDNSSATAITSSGTNLVTERDVYYGLPSINNSHSYTANTSIYAPTAGGTANYFLMGNGTTTAPKWVSYATALQLLGEGYGTCSTAEATTAKVGTLASYQLVTGGVVAIKFTYAVPTSSTLNINGKGAKSIYRYGAAIETGAIKAGDIVLFVYDGTQYDVLAIDTELKDYVKSTDLTTKLGDYVTLSGSEALTNKTYNGYTLAAACAKGVTDNSSAKAFSSSGATLLTERSLYYGLPTINNSHAYTSSTTIYAPTAGGTANYFLLGNGTTTAPKWVDYNTILQYLGTGYGTCATDADTTAKVGTLANYQLVTGGLVAIKFSYAVPASATLNINSKGAKDIYRYGNTIEAGQINAGDVVLFIYNGTQYEVLAINNEAATFAKASALADYAKTSALSDYAKTSALSDYVKTTTLSSYVTLTGSEALTNKTYNGYTLAAACAKGVTDRSTATAISSSGTNLVTERSVYYGMPTINNSHAYTSSTSIYAPTAGGTANYFLAGAGTTTAPKWVSYATALAYMGVGYGTCATEEATTAKVGTLSNYQLVTGGLVAIKFTYAVPASATLNINSKGAKNIYRFGAAITAGQIKAGDTALFVYDGTQYEVLAVNTEIKDYVKTTDLTTKLADYAKTSVLADYVQSSTLSSYVTISGSEALTGKTYNGYTLAAACAKGVKDNSSAAAISSSGTNLVTERDVYYGLPTINNAHNYTSSTTIYAPTAGGTANYFLMGNGTTTAPKWTSYADVLPYIGIGYGTCATEAATTAKVGTLANYQLVTGGLVAIKFTYAVPASATLNINSKGAKNIYRYGAAITANTIKAGDIVLFLYNGTQYEVLAINTEIKDYVTSSSLTTTLADYAKTSALSDYAKTSDLDSYVKTTVLADYATLSGSEALTNKTYNGYTLAAACAKDVKDNSAATAISTGTGLVTERSVYYGLPSINNSHAYTSSTTIYAPTAGGTANYFLMGNGTTSAPKWTGYNAILPYIGAGYGTCSTEEATTAKVGTLANYLLATGGLVAIKFTYAVPASATLNINSQGAKAIYRYGAAITAGVIKAGDVVLFVYNGTQYEVLAINTEIKDYVTSSSLTTTLNSYVKTSTLSSYATTASLSSYAKTTDLDSYVKSDDLTTALADYATLTGSEALTNKTYNGYTLAAACAKGVKDNSTATAISTGTDLVTERDVYYGLPKINNSHAYTSNTNIYAPTAGGTANYFLTGNGTTAAPVWTSYANALSYMGIGFGSCSTAEATTAKIGTLANYQLVTGGLVAIKFSYAVPASATLNINSKGAKDIYRYGNTIEAGQIKAGDIVLFVYNGGQYEVLAVNTEIKDYVKSSDLTTTLKNYATLTGTENLKNKTYNGYTLGDACAKGVTDNSTIKAISTGTNLVTERSVYCGLPTINNSHAYDADTTIYAPTSGGTSNYFLTGTGASNTPDWTPYNLALRYMGCGYVTCATEADTVAKVASLSNYQLVAGGLVAIKFTYAVPASATLNINSRGAKDIYRFGAAITAGQIKAGDVVLFVYNGTQYEVLAINTEISDYVKASDLTTTLSSYAKTSTLSNYVKTSTLSSYATLSGSEALTNKTYEGYTLGAACAKAVKDNTAATALSSSGTSLVTERSVYFGSPNINNSHAYTSATTIYAPTAGGTSNYFLVGAGVTAAPKWASYSTALNYMGVGYGTCTTAADTTAKVGTLANYLLTTGGLVAIKFTYAVPASATLNINSAGAKAIYRYGAAITANTINAGDVVLFVYTGSVYEVLAINTEIKNYVTTSALTTTLSSYAKTSTLSSYATLSGSEALTNKTYNGYTLGAACAKAVKDNTAATALSSSGTSLVTEEAVYYGLPTINNSHAYTSSTTIYAPTAGGTANYFLLGAGTTTAPKWVSYTGINPYMGCGYGTCTTAKATTAKVGGISNYNLCTGGLVAIRFTYAVPASSTLNINSKGAKSITRNGKAIDDDVILAGDVVLFVYTGSVYEVLAINNEATRLQAAMESRWLEVHLATESGETLMSEDGEAIAAEVVNP